MQYFLETLFAIALGFELGGVFTLCFCDKTLLVRRSLVPFIAAIFTCICFIFLFNEFQVYHDVGQWGFPIIQLIAKSHWIWVLMGGAAPILFYIDGFFPKN